MLDPADCNTQHSHKYWQKYNRKCFLFFLSQLFISAGIETFPVGPGQLQCSASASGLGLRGQLHSPGRHAAIGPVPAPTPARPFLCQSGPQRVFHHQFGSPQCLLLSEPPRRDRGSHHAPHLSPEHSLWETTISHNTLWWCTGTFQCLMVSRKKTNALQSLILSHSWKRRFWELQSRKCQRHAKRMYLWMYDVHINVHSWKMYLTDMLHFTKCSWSKTI